MSKRELENWQKIKEHFEEIEQTDSYYYKRAVAICDGKEDPMKPLK
tara:strand:+ start:204 stop:341 length:138 start_codon:yes stop_codon:yes gene_type:complete